MANVQAAFGTIKGKIGNLRFSDWNGVNTVAQQPASYTDAKTPVQVSNRSSFKALAQAGRKVIAAIRQGLAQYNYKTSPWAKYMELGALAFKVSNGQVFLQSPERLVFSRGDLPGFTLTGSSVLNTGGFTANWQDNSTAYGAHSDDLVSFVVVANDGSDAFAVQNVAKRYEMIATVDFPKGFPTDYSAYAYFADSQSAVHTSDSVLLQF